MNEQENLIPQEGTEVIAVEQVTEELEDELLPAEIDEMPLAEETTKIVTEIIKSENVNELKELTKMFTLNQAKKNALRIVKLNNLLDMVNDQAISRIEKRPDEISNKELLDYMNVVSTQIEKSQKSMTLVDETPLVQLHQQNNSVTVNVNSDSDEKLNRDSKEKVIDAVRELLKMVKSPEQLQSSANIEKPLVVNIEEKEN